MALTKGATKLIYNEQDPPSPTVQLIKIVKTTSGVSTHYKLYLSDGEYYIQGTATTHLNPLFESGQVQEGTVVTLEEYVCNPVHNRRLVILMGMTIQSSTPLPMIGNPIPVEKSENQFQQQNQLQQSNAQLVQSNQNSNPPPQLQQQQQFQQIPQRTQFGATAQSPQPPFQNQRTAPAQNPSYGGSWASSAQSNPQFPGQQPNSVFPNTSNQPKASGFIGQQNQQQNPFPSLNGPNAAPVAANARTGPDGTPIYPIDAITPYNSRWTMRARVTFKSPIKNWESSKGTKGTVASVDLLDETGEIRCTLFNEAVDNFYQLLEVGKVYLFSKGIVKQTQREKKFSSIRNDYEMSLNQHSIVTPCVDDGTVPQLHVNPVSLAAINDIPPNEIIDVCAMLMNVSDVTEITTKKDGRQLAKRTLTLVDDTERSIELTLWGEDAQTFSYGPEVVLIVKNVRISDFGGRSLNAISGTHYVADPKIPRAQQLRAWWESQNPESLRQNLQTLSLRGNSAGSGAWLQAPVKYLVQGRDDQLGKGNNPSYFQANVTVMMIKHDENSVLYYNACPTPGCNKKVTQNERGMWYCIKCNKETPQSDARYILNILLADQSGGLWVSAFNDESRVLLGVEARDIRTYREHNDPNLNWFFEAAMFSRFNVRIKASEERYNEEDRMRCSIVGIHPLDYAEESKKLVAKIVSEFYPQ